MRHILLLLALTACSSQTEREYVCIVKGEACEKVDTRTAPSTERGDQGIPGRDGKDAEDCILTTMAEGTLIQCGDQTSFVSNGSDGADGIGQVGAQGESGADGTSCTVAAAVNGALITCGSTSTLVLNGTDGVDGSDGQDAPPTAYTITQVIDPCGDKAGKVDEVLLKLANGQLIASFSDNASGLNTRFSILGAGSYVTTDGTACYFTVDASNNLVNEHY